MVASSGDPAPGSRIAHHDIPALHAGGRTLTIGYTALRIPLFAEIFAVNGEVG
jgi:hypothetical protein